jgi:hypothetical protein
MPINHKNFDSVWNVFDRNAIYVVPTFQRPYAWEEKQLSDLLKDIKIACDRSAPYHYLSPIHLVKVDTPNDTIWQDYTDKNNPDIQALTKSEFKKNNGGKFQVYFVVDGQQRLTTLFVLLAYARTGSFASSDFSLSCHHKRIPKIILNPSDDHQHFSNLLGLSSLKPSIKLKSHDRLDNLFNFFKGVISPDQNAFITGDGHVLLLIELDPKHGLQTFLTLNDRGKDLTTFEKLKSLFMDYDINFCVPPKPVEIHRVFGKAYMVLDRHNCIVSEEQFIQVSSINLWVSSDSDVPAKSVEVLYENYFRGANSKSVCGDLHKKWLPTSAEITSQIDYLINILNSSLPFCSSSSIIHSVRTVADDYQIIFKSLGLSIRSLAVLLKFRQVFGCELHDKVATINLDNHFIKDILLRELGKLTVEIKTLRDNKNLIEESDYLNDQIMGIKDTEKRDVSFLEIAEMMELIVFKMNSTKPGTYSATWKNSFEVHKNIILSVTQWVNYIASFGSREKFFNYLLNAYPDTKDLHFKYILREYESFQSGRNLHFEDMEIEHVFPTDPSGFIHDLPSYKFSNEFEYKNFCGILGNKIWLDSGLNRSIKHSPLSIKARAYEINKYGSIIVPPHRQAQSAINLGKRIKIADNSHYKYYLMLRRF